MAARAERLGDRGPSAPSHWEAASAPATRTCSSRVYAVDAEHLRAALARDPRRGRRARPSSWSTCSARESLAGGRDHFGFFDGIAQPAVERRGRDAAARRRPARRRGRLARAGHRRGPARLRRRGRHAARRRRSRRSSATARSSSTASSRMDVGRLPPLRRASARATPAAPQQLAAKIVGRWPDGTPLARLARRARTPRSPPTRSASTTSATRTTRDGLRCPLGAHIRRANPRDSIGFFDGRLTNRHRIVRRGRAYGPPLPPACSRTTAWTAA